jgi:hypothetical protein
MLGRKEEILMRFDAPLGPPQGLQVSRSGGALRFQWKWMTPWALIESVGVLFMTANWIRGVMSEELDENFAWQLAWGLAAGCFFVGFLYRFAMVVVNQTVVEIDQHRLSVRFEPLPWFGRRDISVREIRQLYARDEGGSDSVNFQLVVRDPFGKDRPLASHLPNVRFARYIEQEVERYLGIEDVPVEGELAGDQE